MALTDPELELLVELLADDPAAEVYLEVGTELVRRLRWAEAAEVLRGGLEGSPGGDTEVAWAMLARACLETGDLDRATRALAKVDRDPTTAPEQARVEILVLERAGKTTEARAAAERFLEVDPGDVVVGSVLERLLSPPPDRRRRGSDPMYTVERAEAYARVGRPDRAARTYRRILLAHPGDPGIRLRLAELAHNPLHRRDDLSEELTDPGLVPPEPLDMPTPRTGPSSTGGGERT